MVIEVKAFEETIRQLSRGDGRMSSKVDALCVDMEKRIKKLNEELAGYGWFITQRCDLCDEAACWKHPEGGFRCAQCPKPG